MNINQGSTITQLLSDDAKSIIKLCEDILQEIERGLTDTERIRIQVRQIRFIANGTCDAIGEDFWFNPTMSDD